jgi:hypothetical protein
MDEDQQGTIEVLFRDSWGEATACYELSADGGAEIVARSCEDEPEAAYRGAIAEIRHGLALALHTGRMVVYLDGWTTRKLLGEQ